MANAFERLILRKRLREKGGDAAPPSLRLGRPRTPAAPLPNAGERQATLASLIEERFDAGRSSIRAEVGAALRPGIVEARVSAAAQAPP